MAIGDFLKRVTGAGREKALSYEQARARLASSDPATRRALAARTGLEPEMLYYLAADADTRTRALVAANPSTPHQADMLLAADEAAEVRAELAHKIGRLLPDLSADEKETVRERTIELIETLARDQEPRVRAALAEEIKSSTLVPAHVARRLAHDPEIAVCGPILRYSPLLSDADLIELIATSRVAGVIEAIAGRENLAADVSDRVVASLDIPAVATLLANKSATIRAAAMEEIVRHARDVIEWHAPIAMRPDLSVRAVRRIAQFVGRDLLLSLGERLGLDEETRTVLTRRLNERLSGPSPGDGEDNAQRIVQRAREEGRLDAEFVIAAAEAGYADQVAVALTMLSGLSHAAVRRVVTARNAKAITALVWRARLPMRVSVAIQSHVMRLTPPDFLPARGGSAFPLTEDEMRRLLEVLAVAA